ncbi:MAG: hypothetical protein NT027_17985, partial [Proteobacteria bacterium]|nr:hypothetical protein [Pseudomonadota bacterium]
SFFENSKLYAESGQNASIESSQSEIENTEGVTSKFSKSSEVKDPKNATKKCLARLAISPPLVLDTYLGESLVLDAQKVLSSLHIDQCDRQEFVDQDMSRPIFEHLGITNYFDKDLRKLNVEQLEYIQEELNATHVVTIKVNKKKKNIELFLAKFIVKWGEVALSLPKKIGEMDYKNQIENAPRAPELLSYLALLTPNTVTIGSGQTEVAMKLEPGYIESSTRTRGLLPPILSSIGFNKIEHYRAFDIFDANLSLFPSSFLFAIDQTSVINSPKLSAQAADQFTELSVKMYGGCTTFNGQVAGHSPIGTTYLALGIGPCLFQNQREDRDAIIYFDAASRIIFGHRAFFTDRYYFFLEVDQVTFTSTKIYKNDIASAKSVSRGNFGIGWYVADFERKYTSFWLGN